MEICSVGAPPRPAIMFLITEPSTRFDRYSARSAAHGSIRVARRAGSHAATSPTAISSSVTIVNASGSVGVETPRQEGFELSR